MFKFISRQFRKPGGILGNFISKKMEKYNTILYTRLEPHLNLTEPRKILEIGYGPGTGMELLLERNNALTMEGIDFSKSMYKKAGKRNRKNIEEGKATLHYGDIKDFSPGKELYDTVFGINVLYFWSPLEPYLEKIASLLKPGGQLILYATHNEQLETYIFTRNEIFNKYQPDRIKEALAAGGYKTIRVEEIQKKPRTGNFYIASKSR